MGERRGWYIWGMIDESGQSPPSARWWAPWSYRRRWRRSGDARALLLEGVRDFNERTGPIVAPILTELAMAQTPSHLFITCADSRVVPHLITSSGPGDLFILRNIGNLIPRGDARDLHGAASVGAAIEYAVAVLGVGTITVCGHSRCGALAALLNGGREITELPYLIDWLRYGRSSLARYVAAGQDERDPMTRFGQVNVVQQLENLLTHPVVEQGVAAGTLELVGMYFDLAGAQVHVLDRESGSFSPAAVVAE
jgi:carbonic anhydrase